MDGDIIFQSSRSDQSRAVELVTKSRLSHMGVVYIKKGRPYVFEAASTVRLTPLEYWIRKGREGKEDTRS